MNHAAFRDLRIAARAMEANDLEAVCGEFRKTGGKAIGERRNGRCFTASFHGQLVQSGIRQLFQRFDSDRNAGRCPQDMSVVGRHISIDRESL